MRPAALGPLSVPRERGRVASVGPLCARLFARLGTSVTSAYAPQPPHPRPSLRLFSAVVALAPPKPSPSSYRSASHTARFSPPWLKHTPSLPCPRLLSTTKTGSPKKKKKKKKGQKRKTQQPPPDVAHIDPRQAKLYALNDGLGEEQRAVLDLVLNGRQSVFFTGPAGTGKSLLLRRIIKGLALTHGLEFHSCVAVTASTGLAAFNIGGTTLHRFAGIGLGDAPTEVLIASILRDKSKRLRRWKRVETLIIDEISMIDCALFDKLDIIARRVRKKNKPFGGIQLVITGDFYQLPPVSRVPDDGRPRFCFEANAWKAGVPHTTVLTQIYRQSDPVFAGMLNDIREGFLAPTTISTFKSLNRPPKSPATSSPEPTELFPLRREADAANARRMQAINSPVKTYTATYGGSIEDPDHRKRLLSGCMAPEVLELKEGAQVMLIKNLGETLVNGSLGRVVGFENMETFFGSPYPQFRPRRLQHREVLDSKFPVVEFQNSDGYTQTELCVPEAWSVERWVPEPRSAFGWKVEQLAVRTQVPLILAWALSIHKSQGQTLDLVKVDLNRVFETGQAYVALSRSKTLEGLQVLNFKPEKVFAHPKVREFYASLSNT